MSSAEFSIVYDGPDLSGHMMSVQQLGPALLAIGDLCQEANRVLNGDDMPPVTVNVKATHQGCFDIGLVLDAPKDADILVGAGLFTAGELLKYIGLAKTTSISLWGFFKRKKGRKLRKKISKRMEAVTIFSISKEIIILLLLIHTFITYIIYPRLEVRFVG